MLIQVGGIPGVGKTTINKNVEYLAKKQYLKVERVSGSNILRELANVATIEEMRALPEDARASLRPEMYRRMYENDRNDINTIRLVDGHFIFFDVKGEKYGVQPLHAADKEQMLAMAVITADPEIILQRRLKDAGIRSDRQLNIGFIKNEQRMELKVARYQASVLGVPLAIINNDMQTHEIGNTRAGKETGIISEVREAMRPSQELLSHIKMWSNQ